MNKILIQNPRIINEGRSFIGSVLVEGDKIAAVFEGEVPGNVRAEANQVIDATGKWLIPGVIDDQVHFRDPGLTHKGDIGTESRAAVAGGVTTFMDMPKPSKAELKRLRYLQRRMARQDRVNEARGGRAAKFASKRRQKTLSQFNALQDRIVRRRNDWIEKTTTRLAKENVLVAMEDLDVKAMTKRPKPKPDSAKPGHYLPNGAKAKTGLNRSILSNNWSRLMTRLNDKMAANGGRLVIVPAAYTSQACHKCGHVAKGNRDSQAVFHCVECGYGERGRQRGHEHTKPRFGENGRGHRLGRGGTAMAVP